MNKLECLTQYQRQSLIQWCERRQSGGYNGRTNKDPDSCYSFWIGATLSMLGQFKYTDMMGTKSFLLDSCQYSMKFGGGFSKFPDAYPDLLHTFYSICWMSMHSEALQLEHNKCDRGSDVLRGLNLLNIPLAICSHKSTQKYDV